MEKYIAIKNGKLSKHYRKWGIYDMMYEADNIDIYVREYVDQE